MSKQWAIIADDFTGAGDSAVQFVSYGKPVFFLVKQDGAGARQRYSSSRTVVIDTDSRFLGSSEAYRRVAEATRALYGHGYRHFFKKIDSTLRGNIASEIAAVMDAGGFRFAIVAPAAPKNGRTVVGGICRIGGVPLSETALANDPFTPVVEARVLKHLAERFSGAVEELNLGEVRSGTGMLVSRIQEGLARGIRVFIADTETMDDLRAIASLASQAGALFVGSSGLAEAVADYGEIPENLARRFPEGKILFSIGSLTDRSETQIKELLMNGEFEDLVVDSSKAVEDPAAEAERLRKRLDSIRADRPLLLRTDGIVRLNASGVVDKSAGAAISRFIGAMAKEIVDRRSIRLVFASGGDTAARIVDMLDTEGIRFINEIVPGIPFGYFRSRAVGRRVYFITKSGGFGGDDAMLKCFRLVRAGRDKIGEEKRERV
jgi:uncharacterized protein YgbK (DUF1537 family)